MNEVFRSIVVAGLFVSLIVLFAAAAVWIVTIDWLIRHEFRVYPGEWKKDGMPYGYFTTLAGTSWWTGGRSRFKCEQKWFKRNPNWAIEDDVALKYLRYYRLSRRLGFIAVLIDLCLSAILLMVIRTSN
jgi:hypothetical protein